MSTIFNAVSIFLFGTAFIGIYTGGDTTRICLMMLVAIYLKQWGSQLTISNKSHD